MSREKETQAAGRRKISFQLSIPDAREVILMGDFNQWDPTKHPMKRNNSGIWQKNVSLVPGTYEYKFRVDGEWENDPENPLVCPNCYGTRNSFIVV